MRDAAEPIDPLGELVPSGEPVLAAIIYRPREKLYAEIRDRAALDALLSCLRQAHLAKMYPLPFALAETELHLLGTGDGLIATFADRAGCLRVPGPRIGGLASALPA